MSNSRGAELMAEACAASPANGKPILLLHLSSEAIFGDNVHGRKYTEEAEQQTNKSDFHHIQLRRSSELTTQGIDDQDVS
ncbi:MAG: hypothetical protein P0120_11665 [Nitrospira sp.]|nr:hypothetical protein [Nitrospira sp.]